MKWQNVSTMIVLGFIATACGSPRSGTGSQVKAQTTENQTSDAIEKVYSFLKDHVEFKRFQTSGRTEIATGAVVDASSTNIVSSVSRNDQSLQYILSWNIQSKKYDRLPDGSLSTVPFIGDRMGTTLCTFSVMRSVDDLIGSCVIQSNSGFNRIGSASGARISLAEQRLTVTTLTSMYFDMYGPGNSWVPGRSESTSIYHVNGEGKSVEERSTRYWQVNPANLERTTDVSELPKEVIIAE